MTQIDQKNTYTYMNKSLIIEKLIKVSSQIIEKNAYSSDPEPTYHFEDVVLYQALRMLTNKQLNKLIKKQKSLL
tara:strand:+ start:123 stop:344 length:222 start_codon:yes stop_codon:yes gene_type:complete